MRDGCLGPEGRWSVTAPVQYRCCAIIINFASNMIITQDNEHYFSCESLTYCVIWGHIFHYHISQANITGSESVIVADSRTIIGWALL